MAEIQKQQRMRELVELLQQASKAYYAEDREIISSLSSILITMAFASAKASFLLPLFRVSFLSRGSASPHIPYIRDHSDEVSDPNRTRSYEA